MSNNVFSDHFVPLSKSGEVYWKRNDINSNLVPDILVSQVEISNKSETMLPKIDFGAEICSAQLTHETLQAVWQQKVEKVLVSDQTNLPNEHF